MELADTGATLRMDRSGLYLFSPTPDRIGTIAALAARGYADRMVLAQDADCFIDYFGADQDAARAAIMPQLALHAHQRRYAASSARIRRDLSAAREN